MPDSPALSSRITSDPQILGGNPVIRGRRLAVEHVLGMLGAGDSPETILVGYPWLTAEDIRACLVFARRLRNAAPPCKSQAALMRPEGGTQRRQDSARYFLISAGIRFGEFVLPSPVT